MDIWYWSVYMLPQIKHQPNTGAASPWKLKPVRVVSKNRSDTNAAATERLCPPEDGTGRASGMLGPAHLPTFTALWPDDVGWVWLPQARLMWVRWIRLAALWLKLANMETWIKLKLFCKLGQSPKYSLTAGSFIHTVFRPQVKFVWETGHISSASCVSHKL